MKAKKFLALLLSLVMVLALGSTAFASSQPAVPSANDTATVTIKGVEANATVTLYQIVKPVYNTTVGLEKYELVVAGSIADMENPTDVEIATIAQNPPGTGITASSASGSDYTATVGAGMYLVLVKGTGSTVYNPMIVSVNYDKDNLAVGGEVDAATDFTYKDAQLQPVTAYAKSSTPGVDKKITGTNPQETNTYTNEKGNDVAIGDSISFQIYTTFPSYSLQYTDLTFDIVDTLTKGFDAPTGFVVKVNGNEVAEGSDTYSILVVVATASCSFTISFTDAFIRAHGGETVSVDYSAAINNNADTNFIPNKNTATIKYSDDPTDKTSYKEKDIETYSYTFAIDGLLGGTSATEQYKTHEIIKVYEDGKVEVTSASTEKLDTIKVTNPLAGAVFKLTNTKTGKTYEATSDGEGYLSGFTGLDAGTYTLVETQAPAGYVADPTEHQVVISATYNDNGTLASYTITIDGKATSTYEATYDQAGGPTITEIEGDQQTLTIENKKIPFLPSTGGVGIQIFYIVGTVLVLGAGILLVTRKRMSHNA